MSVNETATIRGSRAAALAGVAALLLGACVPLFTDGLFQTLRLAFRLDQTLEAGADTLVHTAVFPSPVAVRKSFVQLSGRLTPAAGSEAPERLTVTGVFADPDTGRQVQKVSLRLAIGADGDFKGRARVRKDIGAGDLLRVTVTPTGSDVAAGSELNLCLDLVRSKKDLDLLPDCLAAEPDGPDDPGGGPEATFSSLLRDHFTPSCAVAGCHSAASASGGLVLEASEAHANLVGVPSSERPQLDRVEPGDPESSYLIHKLRGDADIVGQRMPLGGPFLSAEEVDRFVRWIQNGAADD